MAPRIAWITGSAGFIAGHVATKLAGEGWKIVGIDRMPAGSHGRGQVTGAISEAVLHEALTQGLPELVFHAAGTSSVGDSVRDPAASHRDTVATTETLLDFLCTHARSARLIYPSSAAVYGETEDIPLREDRDVKPVSPYGQHKLHAEHICLAAASRGLHVAVMRLFSVYGPGLRKQLPWELGRKLLSGGETVELFGTGAETRDFLSVADVAALISFLTTAAFRSPLIVNGGTGVATRIDVFAAMFCKMLGVRTGITFNGQSRAGDPKYFQADVSRLASLGFKPQITLDAGLAAFATWLKSAQ